MHLQQLLKKAQNVRYITELRIMVSVYVSCVRMSQYNKKKFYAALIAEKKIPTCNLNCQKRNIFNSAYIYPT